MAQCFDIVFDSVHPSRLARFWADALAGYTVREYDDAEIQRLAAQGLTPDTDPSVAVDGPGPTLWFQQADTSAATRSRIHLDIRGVDRATEEARLLSLGAAIGDRRDDHTVMIDPEGNRFCVGDW